MANSRSIVAIMAYSPSPSAAEEASFVQCVKVLGAHGIALVCPQSLDVSRYIELCSHNGCDLFVQRFDDKWFRSVASYNKFMLCPEFYRRFAAYEFVLIYQLDAWVFSDALDFWCDKGYVYVGAPFFNDRSEMFPFAGNGGFSLRHVASFLAVIAGRYAVTRWNYRFLLEKIPAKTRLRAAVKRLIHVLELALCRVSSRWYCHLHHEHEDFIFAKAFSFMGEKNVPLPEEALFFAFERCPERLFALSGEKLPFGCHAYEKYEPTFWRKWISL